MDFFKRPDNIANFVKDCYHLKPDDLVISETNWKYLLRSVLKGKNILIVGPTGSGKNKAVKTVVKLVNNGENFFYFNLGATTDARSSLIGNTAFDKSSGTIFNESMFVKAIRTENAIILLDELSRAHIDASNILITVLDDLQRYLRLDEKSTSDIVKVANGVCFIATANIGNEYTGTRVMDRALLNRFSVKIEMSPLGKDDEFKLMKSMFNIVDDVKIELLKNIIEIAAYTREQVTLEDSKLSNFISTRAVVEISELIIDGFNLEEIAEVMIYPNFSTDGGVDSERLFVKQLVQKYLKSESTDDLLHDPLQDDDTKKE